MKTRLFYSFIMVLLISSCSYQYRYVYDTHVENTSQRFEIDSIYQGALSYKDSILSFTFYPQPNGVFIEIHNLSNNNIFLLWDKSYFIDPYNNSSKALNTDILNTQNKINDKQSNESIIPKKGVFKRFTTSAKNVVSLEKIDFTTYYLSPNLTLQNNFYNEIYLHNPYWTTSSKVSYEGKKDAVIQHDLEMNRMKNQVEKNNNIGLGFTFKIKDELVDYDFKRKIDKVFAYRYNSETFVYDCVDTLIMNNK